MATKSVEIKPQVVPPKPATASAPGVADTDTKSAAPKPVAAASEVPVGIQGTKTGQFGGQQTPLITTSQTGPRLRGADVHDLNARAAALAWYVVVEDVPQPSRFEAKGVCRECAWNHHDLSKSGAEAAVREHALQRHLFSA